MGVPEQALLNQIAELLGISTRRARELVAQGPVSVRTRPAP
jgi:hypothetical protein